MIDSTTPFTIPSFLLQLKLLMKLLLNFMTLLLHCIPTDIGNPQVK
jgi:hypothetical protein